MKRADQSLLAPSARSQAEETLSPLAAPQSPTTNLDWSGGFLSPLQSVILTPLRPAPLPFYGWPLRIDQARIRRSWSGRPTMVVACRVANAAKLATSIGGMVGPPVDAYASSPQVAMHAHWLARSPVCNVQDSAPATSHRIDRQDREGWHQPARGLADR